MTRERKITNALKRSEVHRKDKREKAQAKLKRRMEIRKAEKSKEGGKELRKERLAKNVPRTLDNTRVYDSSSYLTANPATLQAAAERAAAASRLVNETTTNPEERGESDEDEDEEDNDAEDDRAGDAVENGADDDDKDQDEEMPEAGPSTRPAHLFPTQPSEGADDTLDAPAEPTETTETAASAPAPAPTFGSPPRILITTSVSPCKDTYTFCDELTKIFPGGKFFKRPKGKGYELGRVARWSAKRGFDAMIVVNEDHKAPNAITLMKLPAGPTAYFKLTSIQLGRTIIGHARASPHSPELILNNFSTLLGTSVGRLFGSLFPPVPQFRGRQVVTLHNQRDFLFFRRHRYVFDSPSKARLQEIGPRFTLKLRWLRKGLPAVTARDGRIPAGAGRDDGGSEDEGGDGAEGEDSEMREEKEAMGDIGKPGKPGKGADGAANAADMVIPALDEEQEYEWKWKPKMEVSRRTFFL